MLSLQSAGLDELDQRLGHLPSDLLASLRDKAQTLGDALVDKIRTEKLAGGALAARTGALAASIGMTLSQDGAGVEASVGSFGDVKYAAILEYGGRTAAHEILPDKGAALAFVVDGALRFARRVEHPGSTIPAHAYMRSSLEELSDDIRGSFADVFNQTWERT